MFSKRLKKLREEKELYQKDIGEIIGVSGRTIGMYEQGRREPDFDTLLKLSDFFNVSIDYLLGKSDEKNPKVKKGYTTKELNKLADDDMKEFFKKEDLKYIKFAKEMKEEDIDIETFQKLKEMVIDLKNKYKDE